MEIPAIGTRVSITTDWSDKIMAIPWPKTSTIRGVIVESNDWDDKDTVKLMRDPDTVVPGASRESVIYFKRILNLEVLEKGDAPPPPSNVKYFEVTGSKGDLYTVTKTGEKWSCNCQAGNRGITCRHIKEAQSRG